MSLITVRTFETPIEAHLLKSKLESEDIPCFLFDENMVGANPLFSLTIGGVKLKVREEDAEKVSLILQEMVSANYLDDNGNSLVCPHCKSKEIVSGYKSVEGIKGVLFVIFSILVMAWPFHNSVSFFCKSCERTFKTNLRS